MASRRPICDRCGAREAVVYQPHTGRRLCLKCFEEDIVERVRREIERWNMLRLGKTRLLLALSGGKDSLTLLYVMTQLHSINRMAVLTVYEGAGGGYRLREIENLKKFARSYGVDVAVVSFRDYIGADLAELVRAAREAKLGLKPCTICGTLRRRIINWYARLHGFEKVATAHNLDDEVQTLYMNILRGDLDGLLRLHPLSPTLSDKLVPRVKPLRKIYEWETAALAYLKGWELPVEACPLITEEASLRARIREALYRYEWRHPGYLLKTLERFDEEMLPLVKQLYDKPRLPLCEKCGEPTSYGRRVCRVCEIIDALKERLSRPLTLAEPRPRR